MRVRIALAVDDSSGVAYAEVQQQGGDAEEALYRAEQWLAEEGYCQTRRCWIEAELPPPPPAIEGKVVDD